MINKLILRIKKKTINILAIVFFLIVSTFAFADFTITDFSSGTNNKTNSTGGEVKLTNNDTEQQICQSVGDCDDGHFDDTGLIGSRHFDESSGNLNYEINMPNCIRNLLAKKEVGWKERYLIILPDIRYLTSDIQYPVSCILHPVFLFSVISVYSVVNYSS